MKRPPPFGCLPDSCGLCNGGRGAAHRRTECCAMVERSHSQPAVTPDPDDFVIIREELESLGAKSATTPDWINQWVVAEEDYPPTSMQTQCSRGEGGGG